MIPYLYESALLSLPLLGLTFVFTSLVKLSPRTEIAIWILCLLKLSLPLTLFPELNEVLLASFSQAIPAHAIALKGGQVAAYAKFPVTHAEPTNSLSKFLFYLWLLGIVLFVAHWLLSFLRLQLLLRKAREVSEPDMLAIFQAWQHKLGLRRKVLFLSSDRCISPFSAGLVRPCVFIPKSLFTDSRSVVESVIAHELGHVARHDLARIAFLQLCGAIHFLNPFYWLVRKRIEGLMEIACDDLILSKNSIERRDYGNALLVVLQQQGEALASVAALFGAKRRMKMRLRNIAFGKYSYATRRVLLPFMLLVAFCFTPDLLLAAVGRWSSPVPGSRVTLPFGLFANGRRFHKGIDLAAKEGTAALAPAAGIVLAVSENPGDGKHLVVDHGDGIQALYTHFQEIRVTVGQKLRQGMVLGAVGNTGLSTGPHLYFEVRKNGEVIDPQTLTGH